MKNTHKYNYFKKGLEPYSKIIWKNAADKQDDADTPAPAESEAEKRKAEQVDLLVQRGTVRDFVKKRVKATLENKDGQVAELLEEIVDKKMEEMNKKIADLEAKDTDLEGQIVAERERITALEGKNSTLESELESTKQEIAGLEAKDTELEGQIATERENITNLEGKNSALESELESAKQEIADMKRENANFKQLLKDLERRLDLQGLTGAEVIKRNEFDKKIGELTAKDTKLEARIDSLKNEPRVAPD